MLGKVLRDARIAADLTQEELAYRAGLDRTYISLLEHDRKSPTTDVLFRLANAVGVKASVLIARVERGIGGKKEK